MRKKKRAARNSQNTLIVIAVLVLVILIYLLFSAFSVTGNYWRTGSGLNFWIRYTCEETDTGAIVKDRAGAEFVSKTNSCSNYETTGATLTKYHCKSHSAMMWYTAKKLISYEIVACSDGCKNNACMGSETPTGKTGDGNIRAAAPMPKPERTAN